MQARSFYDKSDPRRPAPRLPGTEPSVSENKARMKRLCEEMGHTLDALLKTPNTNVAAIKTMWTLTKTLEELTEHVE